MKIVHNIFDQIISLENLFHAWDIFKVGKRSKADVQEFERNLEDNIFALHKELEDKTYIHRGYTSFYITDPKVRHIHKALVRDRVIHHALFNVLYPIFDKTFISESYSCRINKGTHKAVDRFQIYSQKVTKNHTKKCFVLKCDIQKFFASIDHAILKTFIENKIKDKNVLWLINIIIDSFHSEVGLNKGAPIGNLTSQLFANIYLTELDQFIKQNLKIPYYIRYTDDFVILSESKEFLIKLIPIIEKFLKSNLKLTLHPNKISIRPYHQGIDFLGYVLFPHHRTPRTRTRRRIFNKLESNIALCKNEKIPITTLDNSLQSYFGFLKHANSYKLTQKLKNQIWFWLQEK
ncbi:MAG: group II intron reverse transcriptase domain-containing protein [Candidatus Harrisonbacteria bacterium]|nr:group II intron reverse transcriptase domain-containing protein [Candidatus Harrisonbacteria bacterium]